MRIADHFIRSGDFCFRWRSYLPLVLLPLFIFSLKGYAYPYGSYPLHLLWELGCLFVSMTGMAIRVMVSGTVPVGTSGRNTREQKAATLNTTGIYSIVRHPLYLGNYLWALGASLLPREWWLPVIVTLAFILYYERIMSREERFLEDKFGDPFRQWAEAVPAAIPRFGRFRPSILDFSIRAALLKEFHGIFQTTSTFFIFDLVGSYSARGKAAIDPIWAAVFLLGLAFYVVMMVLKKRTRLLVVTGR